MTKQEILDRAWKHFITDNNRSGMEAGVGRIRTSDGRRCALGILVPDDKYVPAMDANEDGPGGLIKFVGQVAGVDVSDYNFLGDLMFAHDASSVGMEYGALGFNGVFKKKLIRLAERYGLKVDA